MALKVKVAPLKLRRGDELACWEEFLFRFDVAAMGVQWEAARGGSRGSKGKGKAKGGKSDEVDPDGSGDEGGERGTEDRLKGAALFTAVGEEGQEIAMRWGLTLDTISYTDLVKRFQDRFKVCENIPLLRHRLMNLKQKEGESLTVFVERVKGAANKCQLGDQYDSWVALFIVNGIVEDALRTRLLELKELTLGEVEDRCARAEAAERTAGEIRGGERSGEVARVEGERSGGSTARVIQCFSCGKDGHVVRECARTMCFRCGWRGHTADRCSRGRWGQQNNGRSGQHRGRGAYRGNQYPNRCQTGARMVESGEWDDSEYVGEVSGKRQ